MAVLFEASFAKDLKRVSDRQLLQRVQSVVEEVKTADTLTELRNVRKLQGYDAYYRIRVGEYRIGLELVAVC